MPAMGLEPIRCCHQQILSLPRLPFRHAGICDVPHNEIYLNTKHSVWQENFLIFLHNFSKLFFCLVFPVFS